MTGFPMHPRTIARTGDDTPARSLPRFVWRMSGYHQIALCILAMTVVGLSMAPLELQRRIVDGVLAKGSGAEAGLRLLLMLGAAYLAVLLLQAGLKYVLHLYQGWIGESAIRYCRRHLSERYGKSVAGDATPPRESANGRKTDSDGNIANANGNGQAVSVIGPEIDKLGGFVGEGLAQPCVNVGMILAIGGYMAVVEPMAALFSVPFLLPQFLLVPILQRHLNRLTERRVALMRQLSDTVANWSEATDRTSDGQALFDSELDRLFVNRMRFFIIKFAMKGLINLLNNLAPLSALVFGGLLVLKGETTLGVVIAFTTGFDRLADPLRELIAYYRVAALANVQHRMIARWI